MSDIGRIVLIAARNRKAGRAAYEQTYGVSPDDASLDAELARLFKEADLRGAEGCRPPSIPCARFRAAFERATREGSAQPDPSTFAATRY